MPKVVDTKLNFVVREIEVNGNSCNLKFVLQQYGHSASWALFMQRHTKNVSIVASFTTSMQAKIYHYRTSKNSTTLTSRRKKLVSKKALLTLLMLPIHYH